MSNGLKLALYGLLALVCLYLGWYGVGPEQAVEWVRRFGLAAVALSFAWFAVAMVQLARGAGLFARPSRQQILALLALLTIGLFIAGREPAQFKVVDDEIVLSATAFNIHLNRDPTVPAAGYELDGSYRLIEGYLDKRPLVFPFVLSLVHDLTGYRAENAFHLNGLLSVLLVGLIYVLGRMLAGRRAAWLAVLMWACLPLAYQNASGGGLDLLNLVFLLTTLILGIELWRRPQRWQLVAFVIAASLLARTRYESASYLVLAFGLLALLWWRRREVNLPWELWLVPPVMLLQLLHLRVFATQDWAQQVDAGTVAVFAPGYIAHNLGAAIAYLIDWQAGHSMNPLVGVIGSLGLLVFLYMFLRRLGRVGDMTAVQVVFGMFTLAVVANFVLLLAYRWGDIGQLEASRLALPLLAFMVLASASVLARLLPGRAQPGLVGVLLVGLYSWTLPATAAHRYTDSYYASDRLRWSLATVRSLPKANRLVLSHKPWLYMLYRIPSGDLNLARARREGIAYHLAQRSFDTILVIEHLYREPANGSEYSLIGGPLNGLFELEPVAERAIRPFLFSRISRIRAVKPVSPGSAAGDPEEGRARDWVPVRDPEQLRRWWRNLP